MPYDGYEPIKIEKFGGLNTLIDPTNMPIFASPDCQDVEFIYGLVRTRPGIVSQFTPLANNPTVNYLKTYITNAQAIRMLALDSLGALWKENPQGTLGSAGTIENTGVYANSVSLFGREYLAIGDGKFGTSIPRQFDDTNFDRVSQVGPGAPPSVTDESLTATIAAASGCVQKVINVNAASEVGNVCTITLASAFTASEIQIGDLITINGIAPSGYNGTFQIASVNVTALQFSYVNSNTGLATVGAGGIAGTGIMTCTLTAVAPAGFAGLGSLVTIAGNSNTTLNGTWTVRAAANGGTTFEFYTSSGVLTTGNNGSVTSAGSVVAGFHKVSVLFVTRQGYFTAPSPTGSWLATGNKRAVVANIPTGPSNVVQRILLFTASGGSSFFYQTSGTGLFSGNFTISDNTTTTTTVDFSDTTLLSGTNADLLFRQIELGECSGVFSSASGSRLLWIGERKKDTNGGNFINLTFDGGFGGVGGQVPLGWTRDATNGAGSGISPVVVWGGALAITGNASVITGMLTQSAFQDYLGNAILQSNTAYSARVRLQRAGAITQGNFILEIFSPSQGSLGTFSVAASGVPSTGFQEYSGSLLAAQATIPADTLLRVYANGTLTQFLQLYVDNIEIYPTLQPYNVTIVRVSKASQPEAYDGFNGFMDVAPSNGQAVRGGFIIRNNIYLVKERSLYVTQDDGENEAALWPIQEVSAKVGTLSIRGVGLGDEWAIIAGQSGVYYFDGGEPQKLSQEIQPTWDAINWTYGYLIDVKVDTQRKRVYIDVPFGTSTVNNRKLTLDYTDGFGDPNPTNTVNIAGIGRKWVPWTGNVVGNSQNFILRANGTQPLFIGNSAGNGKIYGLDLGVLINGTIQNTVFTDDGVKINDYWQSGYFQDQGRLDFGYLTANVVGAGSLGIILRKGDQGWLGNVRSWFMSATGFRNLERQINVTTERMAIRLGSVGTGDHFSLQGIAAYARPSVSAPLRGVNV